MIPDGHLADSGIIWSASTVQTNGLLTQPRTRVSVSMIQGAIPPIGPRSLREDDRPCCLKPRAKADQTVGGRLAMDFRSKIGLRMLTRRLPGIGRGGR